MNRGFLRIFFRSKFCRIYRFFSHKVWVLCHWTKPDIGQTTYLVKTYFNPDTNESLEDIINRLIAREIEKSA